MDLNTSNTTTHSMNKMIIHNNNHNNLDKKILTKEEIVEKNILEYISLHNYTIDNMIEECMAQKCNKLLREITLRSLVSIYCTIKKEFDAIYFKEQMKELGYYIIV